MATPRGYKSFADFQREALRPGMRAGWSIDELDMPDRRQELDFDLDPFEAALREAEGEDDDYE
ncbi:MAG TPA: transcriptional regulator [Polyangiaceae bacterium]|nr:transcriptional regulator [Polyangiaceae bacterium]